MNEKSIIHSKKNIINLSIFLLVVILIAFIMSKYLINSEFRNQVNAKIFNKDVKENGTSVVELNSDGKPYIYAFDKFVTVLNKNILTLYTQDAKKFSQIDVNITTPYVATNDKYFALAEDSGNKVYLITEAGIKWEKDIEGQIYRISVSENGYVCVLLENTTYKSIVVVYDSDGNELFRTYLAKSYAICSEISNNNQYLAIGQIDYSGTVVKSVVKLIAIEDVKNMPQDSIVYTYESESSKILNNLRFNDKNEVICMFDTYIQKVTNLSDERLCDINNNNIFVDINMKNDVAIVEKEAAGLFSYKYQVNLKNTIGKTDNLYILENEIPKSVKVSNDLMCLKLVGEVRIINSNGWLVKRYETRSEIKDIVIGESVIGIVFNNKIEIINL